ncbi:pentatricopeptide repeat-containing At2g45350, chloroplastic [Olea europaea subsp. europaea]|uniref:Pentatricopeptide repeat-containing At2g45350, chloroplastic n=1 Tax=Olea europaea subsp. europaea TaxID=158383 RepID=A0A8S0RKP8_OLEEU|nr:pentatricopeptide repeat-containing At2g45350, chloroplastic [Olea europaea subsp. europaea]
MPERDVISWATMVDGYAKIGNVDVARGFFDSMPQRDVISCNAMMVGYVKSGLCKEALRVFHDMLSGSSFDLAPDNVTLLTALSAIAQLGCIEEGVAIHRYMEDHGFVVSGKLGCIEEGVAIHRYMEDHGFVVSGKLGVALIDMYAKCGSIERAMNVFEDVEKKGIDHWNTIIGGLAIHGLGDLAFGFFLEMERLHLEPDDITFIAVLNACGHAGLVKEGVLCFEIMRRIHKMEPKLQHYGCMVDILARAGHVEEATRFVKVMPIEPNDVIWRTLLSACTNHEKLSIGEPVAKHLIGIDSYNPSSYILLSNMYAQFGLWDYVRQVRTIMKERDLKKVPGCSWIELEGSVHQFFV